MNGGHLHMANTLGTCDYFQVQELQLTPRQAVHFIPECLFFPVQYDLLELCSGLRG